MQTGIQPRLPWRFILPVVQTVLYCALMAWGYGIRYTQRSAALSPPNQYVLVQEGNPVAFDPEYVDGPPPTGYRIAFALNLPALILSTPLVIGAQAALGQLGSRGSDVLVAICVGLMVPWIWYVVGCTVESRGRIVWLENYSRGAQYVAAGLGLFTSFVGSIFGVLGLISAVFKGPTPYLEVIPGLLSWSAYVGFLTVVLARRRRST